MAFWGEWGRYVPVAERRAKARREMDKLRKKGKDIQPVNLDGRTIARSFWGKGWCDHLESFSDYANRLPRGRTYVRNGSVCHLDIQPGRGVDGGNEAIEIGGGRRNIMIHAIHGKSEAGSRADVLCGRIAYRNQAVLTEGAGGGAETCYLDGIASGQGPR